MTDLELRSPNKVVDIAAALSRTWQYITALQFAASMCASNFTWLHFNSLKYIPMLDFDVICGASPRLQIQKQLAGERSDRDSLSLMTHPGTATTSFLLETLTSFIVPPGTTAEILDRKERLSDDLSSRSKDFLHRIRIVVTSTDPTEILTSSRHIATRALLSEDLSDFADDFRNQSLLSSLVKRSVRPEELIGDDPFDSRAMEALHSSYKFLQLKRPRHSTSNFHDAMNAGLLVRLFNSDNMRVHSKCVPILVSQTAFVRELQNEVRGHLNRVIQDEPPILFANSLFLLISEGLLSRTEGRYLTAIDQASLLAQEAGGLISSCKELIVHCKKSAGSGRDVRDIKISELPQDDWEMLLHRRGEFQRHWGSLLGPMAMVEQRDNQEYLQLLISKDWKSKIRPGDSTSYDKALDGFIDELRAASSEDYDIWNAILTSARAEPERISVDSVFHLRMRSDDGSLLREIASGAPLAVLESEVLEQNHNIQLAVMPAYLSCGAFLTAKSFREAEESSNRYIRVTWLHSRDSAVVIRAVWQVIGPLISAGESVRVSGFTRSGEKAKDVGKSQLPAILDQLIAEVSELQCILISTPEVRCFADTTPLDGIELQVGVTFIAERYDRSFRDRLISAILATSEIPLDEYYARQIVEKTASVLHAPDVWD